ncbi:class Ib ribonucleoside-diphosphate reductase assembly flavoprotein NrdI [Granulosicoccus antarcticus]|uniref:Protein NrdI n=1 Tax=Granulosicoccus antarcticus IMCC3135 TaxID=1192854 RepID=A0A2Z2P1S6_9GAMM|nr:class Ib ribonucleoside-diphosphate reductase assembly flavoprotein NrdI [Granulosicoccus antarcticus]ASJ76805.1 Putative NrdI-like protein [Granulosicoccus antarcticus IMCC3135]
MSSLLYYSSASGNTERFIQKLDLPAIRLPIRLDAPVPIIDLPFVLICPTFADGQGRGAVPKPVIRALNDVQLRNQLRGVIAAGNRNFGTTFALAGDVIARKCQVPVLYRFELAGTQKDIQLVRQGLELFWTQQHSNEP